MKNIYLIAFLLFPFTGISQELIRLSSDNERAQYFEVVPVLNNQETLFKNSRLWINKTFTDSNSVIDLEDKEAAKVVLTVKTPLTLKSIDLLKYTITIESKDQMYRCVIDDFYKRKRGSSSEEKVTSANNKIVRTLHQHIDKSKKLLESSQNPLETKKLRQELEENEAVLKMVVEENRYIDKTIIDLLNSLRNQMVEK